MTKQQKKIIAVQVELNEGSAIKFVKHRGYDRMLCDHVYFGFCQNCTQYDCRRRGR